MMDDAASKHDSTTSPEASIELNNAAYHARYYREARKPRIAAGAETRRYRPISGRHPSRTGYQPLSGASP